MEPVIKQMTTQLLEVTPGIALGVVVFVGFWLASGLVRRAIARLAERASDERRDVWLILANASGYALLAFGVIAGLGTMGIDVTALVAGLGLTGFALGFALRDALSNILAGLLILIYQPFRRGDHISVTGLDGSVISIDLRYTTLDGEGEVILVPNAVLFKNPLKVAKPGRGANG